MTAESDRRVDARRRKDWRRSFLQHAITALVVAAATSLVTWSTRLASVPDKVEALSGLPEQLKLMQSGFNDVRNEAAAAVTRNIERDKMFQKKDQDLQDLLDEQRMHYTQILKDHQELYKQLERRR